MGLSAKLWPSVLNQCGKVRVLRAAPANSIEAARSLALPDLGIVMTALAISFGRPSDSCVPIGPNVPSSSPKPKRGHRMS
jgi:hypothetical protein